MDGQGDLKALHKHFLPKIFWHGQKVEDFETLESVLELPLWQVPPSETNNLPQYIKRLFPSAQSANNTASVNRGYLLLDHHWQKNMGDFEFDPESFQNVKETIKLVK